MSEFTRCPKCSALLASWQVHPVCDPPAAVRVVTPFVRPRRHERPGRPCGGLRCFVCGVTDPLLFREASRAAGKSCPCRDCARAAARLYRERRRAA